ncbi:MAG TPA: hypothetical protein VFE01_03255 [Terracidiphilus sp.]|jgi:hypothetical protein|nr:hypothetical protein [Terracidiphilus sp.]
MMSHRFFTNFLLSAALVFAAVPAHANRDEVQFGSNIVVPPGSSIHDAVCFFCSVDGQGTLDHDVVVFFGNVHIAGHANHDVVDFFGDVRLDENATISHDLVSMLGSVHLGENASIGNDMVAMFGSVYTADSASVGGNRVVQPAWLLMIPLIILGSIVAFIVSLYRSYRRRQMFSGYPYPPPPRF